MQWLARVTDQLALTASHTMSSSQGASASPNGPVLLQLLKYSTATVPIDSVAPVPWKHLSNKNTLFAHFVTSRSRNLDGSIDERSAFRVLQDPDILVRAGQ